MKIENKIINELKENEVVKRYKRLEESINNNEYINKKLKELKSLQKEIVHAQTLNKGTMLEKLEAKYDQLYDDFLNIPVILEYLDLQKEINEFLKSFTSIIEDGLAADLGFEK